jgi:hypothetical protein
VDVIAAATNVCSLGVNRQGGVAKTLGVLKHGPVVLDSWQKVGIEYKKPPVCSKPVA